MPFIVLIDGFGNALIDGFGNALVTGFVPPVPPSPPKPITFLNFNYILQFTSELQARTDPIIGPYLNLPFGNLLDLWVYDLAITKTTLPGYWLAIGRTVDTVELDTSPFLKLLFHYNGSGSPSSLIVNNLDPAIGEHFTIIAGQAGQTFINDWAARNP